MPYAYCFKAAHPRPRPLLRRHCAPMRSPHFGAIESELGTRPFHDDQSSALAVDEYCTL